jgi:hypothetical protein
VCHLQELVSAADLGERLRRDARAIEISAERGFLTRPTHRHRGLPLWAPQAVVDHLSQLHPYAAVVPFADLAASELAAHGAYACPGDRGDWIGLLRPQQLVTYASGRGTAYPVIGIEVIDPQGHIPGTRPCGPVTHAIEQRRRAAGADHESLVVFHLDVDDAVELGAVTPVVRKGRAVPLLRTVAGGEELTLPGIDAAFPRHPLEERGID